MVEKYLNKMENVQINTQSSKSVGGLLMNDMKQIEHPRNLKFACVQLYPTSKDCRFERGILGRAVAHTAVQQSTCCRLTTYSLTRHYGVDQQQLKQLTRLTWGCLRASCRSRRWGPAFSCHWGSRGRNVWRTRVASWRGP